MFKCYSGFCVVIINRLRAEAILFKWRIYLTYILIWQKRKVRSMAVALRTELVFSKSLCWFNRFKFFFIFSLGLFLIKHQLFWKSLMKWLKFLFDFLFYAHIKRTISTIPFSMRYLWFVISFYNNFVSECKKVKYHIKTWIKLGLLMNKHKILKIYCYILLRSYK